MAQTLLPQLKNLSKIAGYFAYVSSFFKIHYNDSPVFLNLNNNDSFLLFCEKCFIYNLAVVAMI